MCKSRRRNVCLTCAGQAADMLMLSNQFLSLLTLTTRTQYRRQVETLSPATAPGQLYTLQSSESTCSYTETEVNVLCEKSS